jgi:hypothetical protein
MTVLGCLAAMVIVIVIVFGGTALILTINVIELIRQSGL